MAAAGFVLLVVGSLGPWRYGKLATGYAWQPVWGVLDTLLGGFVVLVVAAIAGYTFIALRLRRGEPTRTAGLVWIGTLVGLLFVAPIISVIVWGAVSSASLREGGNIGWGLIVATLGAALHIGGLRLQIAAQRKSADRTAND